MNWTFNDLSALASFMLISGIAVGAIGYLTGRYHGHEAGRLIGEVETRNRLIPRIMAAKRDGTRAGRILGIREVIRQVLPIRHLRTRPRKPSSRNGTYIR